MKAFFLNVIFSVLIVQCQSQETLKEEKFDKYDLNSISLGKQFSTNYSGRIVSDTSRDANGKCLRVEMRYPDRRAELVLKKTDQKVQRIGISIFVPLSYIPDKLDEIITQFHGADGSFRKREPPISLRTRDGQYYIYLYFLNLKSGIKEKKIIHIGAVENDRWEDWAWKVSFSGDTDGRIELWKNKTKVLDYHGPNCYRDEVKFPYFKFGIYKPLWKTTLKTEIKNRVLYFDEFKAVYGPGDVNSVYPN